ncbi:MAG: lipoprotein signal peptidase [Bacteroidota bacterium]|nr:lipoprotein signal peptidase [Bacteroidota bacterium]
MKGRNVFFIICIIVIADQALKVYVKTHFHAGESHAVIGNWFRLYFIENEGMAYGWKFGGEWGKLILTLFRLAAVIFGVFYLRKIIQKKYHPGFIVCAALIFAGALGNLIDSMFYGLIFEDSSMFAYNVAKIFPAHGYAGFLHGKVVDMLYFPIIRNTHFPAWIPFWGGEDFEFFRPIFNISDAAISVGIITILLLQKRFFKSNNQNVTSKSVETATLVNDEMQV